MISMLKYLRMSYNFGTKIQKCQRVNINKIDILGQKLDF